MQRAGSDGVLNAKTMTIHAHPPQAQTGRGTYSSRGGLLVAGLASHLEGNAIGGSVLELEGSGGEVIEILVEELHAVYQVSIPEN